MNNSTFNIERSVLGFISPIKFTPSEKEKDFVFINSREKPGGELFTLSFRIITQGVKHG